MGKQYFYKCGRLFKTGHVLLSIKYNSNDSVGGYEWKQAQEGGSDCMSNYTNIHNTTYRIHSPYAFNHTQKAGY